MSSNVFEGKDERLQAGFVMVGKSSRVEQHICQDVGAHMAVWLENIAVASANRTQAYLICENGASLLLEIKEQKVATIDHSLLSQCLSTVLSR